MPTGLDLVRAMSAVLSIPGAHYGADDCPDRCHPEFWPHCEDCSGSICAAVRRAGPDWGCLGSFAIAQKCHAAGPGVPFDVAVNTPGMMGFQGINEGQGGRPGVDHGHVVLFPGDGVHSLEARGHWSGIGLFVAASLVYDWCGFPPDFTRVGKPSVAVPMPPLAMEEDAMTMVAIKPMPNGEIATARPVKNFNFVLLESGARLKGDVAINDGTGRHWWAPPANVRVPGWQIIDVADGRAIGRQSIFARYGFPNGDTGTYEAQIA